MTVAQTHSLGSVQTFGPAAVEPRPSGRWAVTWSIEWEYGELADAMEQLGLLIGIIRATATYRVAVKISPEREPGQRKRKAVPA